MSNRPYTLRIIGDTGERMEQGSTQNDGSLRAPIPVSYQYGEIALDGTWLKWNLSIGHLDPIQDQIDEQAIITGVQARLNNLGFFCGAPDGVLGPKTRSAIKRFQGFVMKKESPNGDLDLDTCTALKDQHGC